MTTLETQSTETIAEKGNRRSYRLNGETWSWYFMRISGLILLFLALFHFFMTHILHDVVDTDSAFVSSRWDNPMWRLYDWTLLALGLFHGANGLRFTMDDYIRVPWKRAATKAFTYGLILILFAYGTITVLTFESLA